MSCAFLGHKHLRGADLGSAAALRGAERGRKEADGASLRTGGCGGLQLAERLRVRAASENVIRVPSGLSTCEQHSAVPSIWACVQLLKVSPDPQNRSKRSPRLGVTAAAARRVVLRPAGAEGTIRAQGALSTKKAPGTGFHAPRRPSVPRAT